MSSPPPLPVCPCSPECFLRSPRFVGRTVDGGLSAPPGPPPLLFRSSRIVVRPFLDRSHASPPLLFIRSSSFLIDRRCPQRYRRRLNLPRHIFLNRSPSMDTVTLRTLSLFSNNRAPRLGAYHPCTVFSFFFFSQCNMTDAHVRCRCQLARRSYS